MVTTMPARTSGFTLIEMMITVSVISVLLTIAVGAYRPAIVNQGVKTAAYDLYSRVAVRAKRSDQAQRHDHVARRSGKQRGVDNGVAPPGQFQQRSSQLDDLVVDPDHRSGQPDILDVLT